MLSPNEFLNLAALSGDLLKHYFLDQHKPSVLVWSLTNRCNLDCDYCGLPNLPHHDLSEAQLMSYLDDALGAGLRVLSLTGGEPLVCPSIVPFVKKAREHGVWISLNTNGMMVPKKIEFIKNNIQQVVVSLDGFPEINDRHRGAGTGQKALDAIKLLQAEKVKTSVVCVLTKESVNRIPELVEFSIQNKVSIAYQLVFNTDLATYQPYSSSLSAVEAIMAMDQLIAHKDKYPKFVGNSLKSLEFVKEQFLQPKKLHCRAGELFMRIEPNGDIRKCGRVEEIIRYEEVQRKGFKESFIELQKFDHCTSCISQIAIKANFKKIY